MSNPLKKHAEHRCRPQRFSQQHGFDQIEFAFHQTGSHASRIPAKE
jgi:hypothetical protein